MIKKKTVFVLGAGASKPYGYPTGEELFKSILNLPGDRGFLKFLNKAFPSENGIRFSGGRPMSPKTKSEIEFESFVRELADSGLVSVDSFIEKKNEYSAFCKFSIAYLLLQCETRNPLNQSGSGGDWYRYVYKLLNEKKFESFLDNNVSFVTFNYDISFDSFLIRALTTQYENEDQGRYFSKNKIIHIHGRVRSFEHSKISKVFDFNTLDQAEEILENSQNIKFYFEQGSEEIIESARLEIKSAENVFFLGFGFLSDNMEKLKINWKNNVDGKAIDALFTSYYGTAFGLEEAEAMKVIEDNNIPYNYHYPRGDSRRTGLKLINCDCLTLIKQNVNVLK